MDLSPHSTNTNYNQYPTRYTKIIVVNDMKHYVKVLQKVLFIKVQHGCVKALNFSAT